MLKSSKNLIAPFLSYSIFLQGVVFLCCALHVIDSRCSVKIRSVSCHKTNSLICCICCHDVITSLHLTDASGTAPRIFHVNCPMSAYLVPIDQFYVTCIWKWNLWGLFVHPVNIIGWIFCPDRFCCQLRSVGLGWGWGYWPVDVHMSRYSFVWIIPTVAYSTDRLTQYTQ